MIVDIATDLMIKALSTDYDTYLDYSYGILGADGAYDMSEIKKVQKKISKARALRDEIAGDLHNTRILDSREHPVQTSMFDKAYPDMFKEPDA